MFYLLHQELLAQAVHLGQEGTVPTAAVCVCVCVDLGQGLLRTLFPIPRAAGLPWTGAGLQ